MEVPGRGCLAWQTKIYHASVNSSVPLQEDAEKQEEGATVPASTEARATEAHSQEEEAPLTADAFPEIMQMMTDIQAALAPAEGLADAGMSAAEASADEGALQTLLSSLSECRSFNKHIADLPG